MASISMKEFVLYTLGFYFRLYKGLS